MFQAIYESPFHHPYFFWAAGLPFLGFLLLKARGGGAKRSGVAWLLVLFQLEILLDSWLTAPTSPLSGGLAQNAAIAFVVLGDARFFLLLERHGKGHSFGRSAVLALAWSLLVPVASLVAKLFSTNMRVIFLTYETMFAALALAFATWVIPRLAEGSAKRWATRLVRFELVQYVLWASADVVILGGYDVGYLLRLVPNSMYYVAFVPFAWLTAPDEVAH